MHRNRAVICLNTCNILCWQPFLPVTAVSVEVDPRLCLAFAPGVVLSGGCRYRASCQSCCGVTVLHQPRFNFHGRESIAQTLYLSLLLAIPVKTFLWRKGTGILCPARCFTLTLRALRIKCIVLLLKDLNVFFPVYTVCF